LPPTPVPTFVPTNTPTPIAPTATPNPVNVTPTPLPNAVSGDGDIGFTYGISLTQNVTFTVLPAVPATENTPFWEVIPEFVNVDFSDYAHIESAYQPTIQFYPIAEFAADPEYSEIFLNTRDLLEGRPVYVPEGIPLLPPIFPSGAAQIIQAHVQYLDFAGGSGVRFITQYASTATLVNNYELIYTFQGLTDDGATYIASIMPVSSAILPASGQVTPSDTDAFIASFGSYLTNTRDQLNAEPVYNFTPNLSELDALFKSLSVRAAQ
jgi:hypothetical protein